MPDPGLAGRRTTLARQRTLLCLAATAGALTRPTGDQVGTMAVAVLALTASVPLCVLLVEHARGAAANKRADHTCARSGVSALALTVAVCLVAFTLGTALLR